MNEKVKKLSDAIKLYSKGEKSLSNSYEWYRKSAQRNGSVLIGNTIIRAYKRGGIWYVDEKEFVEAIKKHRGAKKQRQQDGCEAHGGFRFEWSNYERLRKKSYGRWYCIKCNVLAETEHTKEECHLCSDWNGCGRDCTLSRVYCPKCGASLDV